MNPLWLAAPPAVFAAFWKLRGKGYKVDEQGRYVILDFERPRLPLFNTAFNFFGRCFPKKRLDMDDLIKEAQKRTGGLTDFGDENRFPFRDGLEIILRDANKGNILTPLGRLAVKERVVEALVERLLMVELIKQHPEILDEDISEPVFVIGMPRSGTSHMQRCLAQADELRALIAHEAWIPVFAREVRDGVQHGVDPRVKQAQKSFDFLVKGRALLTLFHGVDINLAEEHFQLCDGVFRSYSPILTFPCEEYMQWYSQIDATVQFDYLKRCLQIAQWRDVRLGKPRRRFLLKHTNDIYHIPHLKKIFPDARIVHIHRDTVSSVLSGVYIIAYFQSLTSNLDAKEAGRILVDYFESSLKRVKWGGCEDHTSHVDFKDFVTDNVASLKVACNELGLEISENSWDKVAQYAKENTQHKSGRIHYDPKTFGFTREGLEERFKFYSVHGSALAKEQ